MEQLVSDDHEKDADAEVAEPAADEGALSLVEDGPDEVADGEEESEGGEKEER